MVAMSCDSAEAFQSRRSSRRCFNKHCGEDWGKSNITIRSLRALFSFDAYWISSVCSSVSLVFPPPVGARRRKSRRNCGSSGIADESTSTLGILYCVLKPCLFFVILGFHRCVGADADIDRNQYDIQRRLQRIIEPYDLIQITKLPPQETIPASRPHKFFSVAPSPTIVASQQSSSDLTAQKPSDIFTSSSPTDIIEESLAKALSSEVAAPSQIPSTYPPTGGPIRFYSQVPTGLVSSDPTQTPTSTGSTKPTLIATQSPTPLSTIVPTVVLPGDPTVVPTMVPTMSPTRVPETIATLDPTKQTTTSNPSVPPSQRRTLNPTTPFSSTSTVEPTFLSSSIVNTPRDDPVTMPMNSFIPSDSPLGISRMPSDPPIRTTSNVSDFPTPQPISGTDQPSNLGMQNPSIISTNIPTARPTNENELATLLPTTNMKTNTTEPSNLGMPNPSISPHQENAPTISPTNKTEFATLLPTVDPKTNTTEPSSLGMPNPSISSIRVPTTSPTNETELVTLLPTFFSKETTTEPSTALANKSMAPSPSPRDVNTRTSTPTVNMRIFVDALVPVTFVASVSAQQNQTLLKQIEETWEKSILKYFQTAFAERSGVQVQSVALDVRQRLTRRLRSLQDSATVTINTIGGADFKIDSQLDKDIFVQRATREFSSTLSVDFLQASLETNASTETVAVGSVMLFEENEMRSGQKSRPNLARIIVGFALLFLALASLVFWARILLRKRKKKLRKQRMDYLRKKQSVTLQGPAPSSRLGSYSETNPPQSAPSRTLTSDGSRDSSYQGIGTNSDETDVQSEAASDDFARELQRAVCLDQAAWEEFQDKQKYISIQHTTSEATSMSSGAGGEGTKNDRVAVYGTSDSRDLGMEVELKNEVEFRPYGNEEQPSLKAPPVRLTAENAVKWTPSGISLGFPKGASLDEVSFEPYGEKKKPRRGRNLQQSWDLDEYPIQDEHGVSQFSFLHPLKRKDLNVDFPDPQSSLISDDSKSSDAVVDAVSVTSIDTPTAHHSRHDNYTRFDAADSDSSSQNDATTSMLKELEEISQYVKRYERKREARPRPEISRDDGVESSFDENTPVLTILPSDKKNQSAQLRQPVSTTVDNFARQTNPGFLETEGRLALDTSLPSDKVVVSVVDESESSRLTGPIADSPENAIDCSFDSKEDRTSDNDDESSMRLGINRFSVEKPKAPNLSYRSIPSDDEPLHVAARNPEEDSLRYSQSTSFEHQRPVFERYDGTIGSMESLENAAYPIGTSKAERGKLQFSPNAQGKGSAQITSKSFAGSPSNKEKRLLSSLRSHKAIIDAPIDGTSTDLNSENDRRSKFFRGRSKSPEKVNRRISPRSRTSNSKFNNILSKFDAKATAPITPSNESWQYTGSNIGPSSSGEARSTR